MIQFIRFCSTIAVRVLFLIWVCSYSSKAKIIHYCIFWVSNFVRNIKKNFEIFSELDQPIMDVD